MWAGLSTVSPDSEHETPAEARGQLWVQVSSSCCLLLLAFKSADNKHNIYETLLGLYIHSELIIWIGQGGVLASA